jgi:hypothetical protein
LFLDFPRLNGATSKSVVKQHLSSLNAPSSSVQAATITQAANDYYQKQVFAFVGRPIVATSLLMTWNLWSATEGSAGIC